MAENKVCRKCGIELTEINWYQSCRNNRDYICKECRVKCSNLWQKNNPERYKVLHTRCNRRNGELPMSENKECASFLGCYVAERMLSKVFNDVERMPYNNPGFDFVCAKGKKVDVKSSCINQRGGWGFRIEHNIIADYFLLLAFDNREDLNPLYCWLIQGTKLNHLMGTTISPNTLDKWNEYQLDITKVNACCDALR